MKIKSPKFHNLNFVRLVIVFLCLLTLGISVKSLSGRHIITQSQAIAQSQEKVITRDGHNADPFDYLDIKVKGRPVKFLEKFEEDGDWIRHIEFKIKNTSDKPIVYIEIWLDFVDTSPSGSVKAFPLTIGRHPILPDESQPILLIKGDVAHIKISDQQYEAMKQFLARTGYSITDMRKVMVRIPTVNFGDQSKWSLGKMYRLDPERSGKWLEIK